MSRKAVRVLLVDDHAVVREGYRTLLEKHEGLTVVGEACDAAVGLPDATRIPARMSSSWTSRCRAAAASTRSSTSAGSTPRRASSSSRCTAGHPMPAGLPCRSQGLRDQEQPSRCLWSARCETSPKARWRSVRRSARCSRSIGCRRKRPGLEVLSPREFEILRMILDAQDPPTRSPPRSMSAARPWRNYHYSIKSKLGVASDIELLYFGLRQGLVEPVAPMDEGVSRQITHASTGEPP